MRVKECQARRQAEERAAGGEGDGAAQLHSAGRPSHRAAGKERATVLCEGHTKIDQRRSLERDEVLGIALIGARHDENVGTLKSKVRRAARCEEASVSLI